MMDWAVGFVLMLLLIRILKIDIDGCFFAILFLGVLPYFIGKFILLVFGVS